MVGKIGKVMAHAMIRIMFVDVIMMVEIAVEIMWRRIPIIA